MPLVQLVILIAVIGLIVYLVTRYVPMPPAFKTAIYVICAIALLIYVLTLFGLLPDVMAIRVGK